MYAKNCTLIQHRDVPGMQKILKENPYCKNKPEEDHLTFTDYSEYQNYIRNIDLYSFLGVSAYQKFSCPFCGKPEGYVGYYDEEKVWTYRCFAEGKTHNIIGIVQAMSGCSYSQAIEYIHQVYNISIENDSPLHQALDYNIRVLSDDNFKENYPCISKFLGSYCSLLVAFYDTVKSLHNDNLHTRNGEEVVVLTIQEMRKLLNVGQEKTRTFLRWITLLSIIDAVPKRNLDTKSRKQLDYIRGHRRREYASIYRIKRLDDDLLDVCETKAKELLPLRLTKRNMTLKTVRAITSEFAEDYEILSPNYSFWKRNAANRAAEEAIQVYSDILMQAIDNQGYVHEKGLPPAVRVAELQNQEETISTPVTWWEVRSAVLQVCCCSAVSANRDQLKLLGITEKVFGILIVPTEKVYSCEADVGEALNDIAFQGYALASKHLPITQNHRKQFRDMLEQCGVIAVRLNAALRDKYQITNTAPYTEIFIERKEGKTD